VLHPHDAVLVTVEARQKRTFQPVHKLLFVFFGNVRLFKAQAAAGVVLGKLEAVDQLNHLLGVAPQ